MKLRVVLFYSVFIAFPFDSWKYGDIVGYRALYRFYWLKTVLALNLNHNYIHIYIFIPDHWPSSSAMARETEVHSQVKSYWRLKKWYLIPPCLILSIIRYGPRVKWYNLRKGVSPSHTPLSSSQWKGNIGLALVSGHQLYLLICI